MSLPAWRLELDAQDCDQSSVEGTRVPLVPEAPERCISPVRSGGKGKLVACLFACQARGLVRYSSGSDIISSYSRAYPTLRLAMLLDFRFPSPIEYAKIMSRLPYLG